MICGALRGNSDSSFIVRATKGEDAQVGGVGEEGGVGRVTQKKVDFSNQIGKNTEFQVLSLTVNLLVSHSSLAKCKSLMVLGFTAQRGGGREVYLKYHVSLGCLTADGGAEHVSTYLHVPGIQKTGLFPCHLARTDLSKETTRRKLRLAQLRQRRTEMGLLPS